MCMWDIKLIISMKQTLYKQFLAIVGQPTWNREREEGEEDKEEDRDVVIMCAWVLSLSFVCTEQISVYVWLVL